MVSYSSADIGKLTAMTAQLGRLRLHHPAAGFHTTAEPLPPIDWEATWQAYRLTLPAEPPQIRSAAAALCVDAEQDDG